MSSSIHILGFAGSLRQHSHNGAALRAAGEVMPDGMTLDIFDLASVPLYNQDSDGDQMTASVRAFKEQIAAADGLLIATPEYNHSIPGVLKNALDWASRPAGKSPLNDKPIAILGASGSGFGTARAQLHLRQVLTSANALTLNKPEVYISYAGKKFEHGQLTDEATRDSIREHMRAFARWIRRLRGE